MRGRNWGLQPLYQLQLLLYEKGLLWRTDLASPAAPSAQGSILSPLKGERGSLPGASGRNASADFFGRKHQGHKSKTQISGDCLTCSQKSESVAWLTVPLCPILPALQRLRPAHCAHAHCPGNTCMSDQLLLLGVIPSAGSCLLQHLHSALPLFLLGRPQMDC